MEHRLLLAGFLCQVICPCTVWKKCWQNRIRDSELNVSISSLPRINHLSLSCFNMAIYKIVFLNLLGGWGGLNELTSRSKTLKGHILSKRSYTLQCSFQSRKFLSYPDTVPQNSHSCFAKHSVVSSAKIIAGKFLIQKSPLCTTPPWL